MVTINLEAETFTLGANMRAATNAVASGGSLIEVDPEGALGIASTTFSGAAGNYDVILHYFDETDGVSEVTISIGGVAIGTVTYDANLGSPLADSNTLTSAVVATGLSIGAGDSIEISAQSDTIAGVGAERARVDRIELISTTTGATIGGDLALNVAESTTSVVLTTADLSGTETGTAAGDLVYTVSTVPAEGEIQVGGAAVTTFTQAQLAAGAVSYVFTGTTATSDSFVVGLDGADAGTAADDTATVNVTIGGTTPPTVGIDNFFSVEQLVEGAAAFGLNVPYAPVEVGGLNFGDLYDEAFYLAENADVAQAVLAGSFSSGFDHFTQFGWLEGRDGSILFDNDEYLAENADVAAAVTAGAFDSALQHFALFGHLEGRAPSSLFDEGDYLTNNADVAAAVAAGAFGSGFEHYIEFGLEEGRAPSDFVLFNQDFYFDQNPDVQTAVEAGIFADGYDHFVKFGTSEGRDPSALFDESAYLTANPDVATAVTGGSLPSGFAHYVLFGRLEGREAPAVATAVEIA